MPELDWKAVADELADGVVLLGRVSRVVEWLSASSNAAGLATGWVRHAAARAEWASTVRDLPAPPGPPLELAAAARGLLARLAGPRPKSRWSSLPLPGLRHLRSAREADQDLGRFLELLNRWVSAPPPPTDPLTRARVAVAHGLRAVDDGHPATRLATLGTELAVLVPTAGGVLTQWADDPDLGQRLTAARPPAFRWPGPAAEAVAVARGLADRLPPHLPADRWEAVGALLVGWFGGFGLQAGVATPPPPGAELVTGPANQTGGQGFIVWVVPAPVAPIAGMWADLPPPPAWDGEEGPADSPPLAGWWRATQSGGTLTNESAAKTAFQSWLQTGPGRQWFARLLHDARKDRTSAAATWWAKVRDSGWVRAYPDLDPNTGAVCWPMGAAPTWPVATSRSDDAPPDTIVEVQRFSPVPDEARLVLSDGPAAATGLRRAFEAVVAAATAAGASELLGGGRWGGARQLSLGHANANGPAAEVLIGWLDELARIGAKIGPAPGGPAGLDRLLAAVRDWAAAFGFEVTPAEWSFADPPSRARLESAGVTCAPTYRNAEPVGAIVRVRQFGLKRPGAVVREATAVVSAGPAPAGYRELEDSVRTVQAAAPLRSRLQEWRWASLDGDPSVAAVQLFVDFWGGPGVPFRDDAPEAAERFANRLGKTLTDSFGLTLFEPAALHEYPEGWVQVVGSRPAMTGRVRKVHRPGLAEGSGVLRLPAVVEVM